MQKSSETIRFRLGSIVAVLGLCALLGGCGQKGPLFLPTSHLSPVHSSA